MRIRRIAAALLSAAVLASSGVVASADEGKKKLLMEDVKSAGGEKYMYYSTPYHQNDLAFYSTTATVGYDGIPVYGAYDITSSNLRDWQASGNFKYTPVKLKTAGIRHHSSVDYTKRENGVDQSYTLSYYYDGNGNIKWTYDGKDELYTRNDGIVLKRSDDGKSIELIDYLKDTSKTIKLTAKAAKGAKITTSYSASEGEVAVVGSDSDKYAAFVLYQTTSSDYRIDAVSPKGKATNLYSGKEKYVELEKVKDNFVLYTTDDVTNIFVIDSGKTYSFTKDKIKPLTDALYQQYIDEKGIDYIGYQNDSSYDWLTIEDVYGSRAVIKLKIWAENPYPDGGTVTGYYLVKLGNSSSKGGSDTICTMEPLTKGLYNIGAYTNGLFPFNDEKHIGYLDGNGNVLAQFDIQDMYFRSRAYGFNGRYALIDTGSDVFLVDDDFNVASEKIVLGGYDTHFANLRENLWQVCTNGNVLYDYYFITFSAGYDETEKPYTPVIRPIEDDEPPVQDDEPGVVEEPSDPGDVPAETEEPAAPGDDTGEADDTDDVASDTIEATTEVGIDTAEATTEPDETVDAENNVEPTFPEKDDSKANPDTGAASAAVVIGLTVAAGGVLMLSRKRR